MDGQLITNMEELEAFIEEHVDLNTDGGTLDDFGVSYRVTLRRLDEDGNEIERQVVESDE